MRTRHNYSYADLGDTLSKKKDAPQDHHSSLILESVYRSHSNLELCCRTLVCKWTSGWLPLYLLSMIPQFHQDHLRHLLITTWIKSNFFTMNVKKKIKITDTNERKSSNFCILCTLHYRQIPPCLIYLMFFNFCAFVWFVEWKWIKNCWAVL